MKNKIILCIFSALLILIPALSACSDGNDPIKAIQDRGELRVGVKVDVPRFGYLSPVTGQMEGLEIDLARIIAKDILNDENKVKFLNITAQTRGPMLDNGEIDIVIATFTITEERKKSFDFSRPYFTDELGFLVRSDSGIGRPEDLDGKKAGVVQAGTAKASLPDECARLGIDMVLLEYNSYPEVKAALAKGDVDVFVADKTILYGYIDDDCLLLNEGFNPQQYGIASKKGNEKLAARIDSLIEEVEKDGRLAALFYDWGL